jgi:chromosome segregation ATPase
MTAAPGVEEITRFLRRFSDLMSTGHNADHLSHAANLIEALVSRLDATEKLFHGEQARSEEHRQLCKSAEVSGANLQKELAGVETELAAQRWKLNEAIISAAAEQQRLLERAERAEARLTAVESELAEAHSGAATSVDGHVLVPISTLRHAEAQFEALAREAIGLVSQVMCEAGASALGRALLESAPQSSEKTSRHAA